MVKGGFLSWHGLELVVSDSRSSGNGAPEFMFIT